MAQQRTVALPSSIEADGNTEENQETRLFFFEYMSRRAEKDAEISTSDAELIKEQRHQQAIPTGGKDAALEVASRLAALGDEIDATCHEEMQEIVGLAGSPENAFSLFFDIVKNLFEWDEQGGAKINIGRIAALLAYCYNLCKTYIAQKVASHGLIITFMGMVAGWLFQFFIKAKFYEWLRNQGGWGQLISASGGLPGWLMGRHLYLVVGVASLAIWAYSYFKSR